MPKKSYLCGAETEALETCRKPVSEPGARCHLHRKRTGELKEVIDAEWNYVAERRKALGLQPGTVPDDLVGLALSGGGIRSATFNLGFRTGVGASPLVARCHSARP